MTDTQDNSEIYTGSCSADQMVIRAQNCVISFECLLLHYCYLSLSVIVLSVLIRLHFCLIITCSNIILYILIIVRDHAHFDDIYIRMVVFETGMCSIYCRLDIWS